MQKKVVLVQKKSATCSLEPATKYSEGADNSRKEESNFGLENLTDDFDRMCKNKKESRNDSS